jgi:hypothetical protein
MNILVNVRDLTRRTGFAGEPAPTRRKAERSLQNNDSPEKRVKNESIG